MSAFEGQNLEHTTFCGAVNRRNLWLITVRKPLVSNVSRRRGVVNDLNDGFGLGIDRKWCKRSMTCVAAEPKFSPLSCWKKIEY
jgi:hypothetical protein